MKRGERYLSGEIDLGALGKVQLRVFRNRNKQKEEHPDYRICVVDEKGDLKRSGALWIRKKQEQEIEGKLTT